MIDSAGQEPGAEAIVDVHHADTAGAGIQHGQEGGQTAESGAVTYAGGNGNDRAVHQTAYHAGQCAFHTCNGNDHPGTGQGICMSQKSVNACHANVIQPQDPVAQSFCRQGGFFGHRQVAGAAGGDDDLTGAVGLVNTASQAAFVCSLKWGHNGLSVAIRNSAAVISMFYALIFLHEKISLINFCGVAAVIISLGVIAIFGKKSSFSNELKKWIPAVLGSLLLSATYQILLTNAAMLPKNVAESGVIIPCLMGFGSIGNLLASLVERKILRKTEPFYHFSKKVWQVFACWIGAALLQYYLLMLALGSMRTAAMSALTWPMLIGVNVTAFSIFCRLKWKEKYPLSTVIGMIGCISGLIMIIWGRK